MELKTKFFSFSTGKAKRDEVGQPFVAQLNQLLNTTLSVGKDYLKAYRGWVYACVTAISQEVGNINLRLYKEKGDEDEEVNQHELLDLFNRVNPAMTKYELFEITQSHMELAGDAFWLLARDGTSKVRELWPLRPDRVEIVKQKENPMMVQGYIYKNGLQKIPLEAKDVLHFKNFNSQAELPFPYRGMGTVEAAAIAIDMSNFSHEWNRNFFEHSATPNSIITYNGELGNDEYERLKVAWEQKFKGKDNAHKTAFLKNGMDIKQIGFNQKEMDFVEQMRFTRDEILAIFRVPKSVLGIVEDVNRANAEASNYVFGLRTIKPKMQRIVDTINEFLVPEFGDDLYFGFDSPVPADRVQTVAEYTAGIDKWYTRNEIRALEGLPPSTQGDSFFGQFSISPIDTVPQSKGHSIRAKTIRTRRVKKASFIEIDDGSKEALGQLYEKVFGKEAEPTEPVKQKIRFSDEQKKNFKMLWATKIEANSNPIKKDVRKYFDDQKEEVLNNIKENLKGLEVGEYTLKAIDDLLFDEEEAIATGIKLITPHLRKIIKEIGDEAIVLSGAEELFNMGNPSVIKFLSERAEYFAETINETSIDALQDAIREGIANGESVNQISDRVSTIYDGWDETRSTLIARTETSSAANFGTIEGFDQAGVKEVEWIVVDPNDEDCLANENEVVKIGQAFPSGHTKPPVHPNCVCGLLPVIER